MSPAATCSPSTRPSVRRGARVLVVEDSPDHRRLIERTLHGAGHEVVAVATGEDALRHLGEVDVVLVDQRLPAMSGTDLLGHVAALPAGPAPVVVTGAESQGLVVEALRMGAVDYVVKSSSYLDELPAVVARAHRQHDLARRYRELQRFALLVHRPTVRDDTVEEIVRGARRFLGADGVALLERGESGGWTVVARTGELDELAGVHALLQVDSVHGVRRDGALTVVDLPDDPGEEAVLALLRHVGGAFDDAEVELATTFAALAASALRQVHRMELERGLVHQLQQTVRVRQDFLASVSHELRTPLTVIAGYVETLLHRPVALSEEGRHDLLRRAMANTEELGRLIDQLLDAAAMDRGRGAVSEVSEVDVSAVAAVAVDEVAYLLEGRGGRRDLAPVTVVGDPVLLRMALVNLLSNACKYSEPGTPVELRAEPRGDLVRVEVRDRGVGVEAGDEARVFDPFWRAGHAVAGAVRGTGIGLSLVRDYVTAMGGEVGVDSEAGEGSIFWFTLPRAGAG